MTIYEENDFANREDYLEYLAECYDVPFEIILSFAELLGPDEDFDGLVIAVEDYDYFG